jgi:Tat protein translocase TatB subunit
VVLLILESLGSTELLFILVMALVFFGPRKLPQLSRSLGKNLAEFRKASEEFKRTWEKEANLEEFDITRTVATREDKSVVDHEEPAATLQPPMIEAVTPDRVIARYTPGADAFPSADKAGLSSDRSDLDGKTADAESSPKHDWL